MWFAPDDSAADDSIWSSPRFWFKVMVALVLLMAAGVYWEVRFGNPRRRQSEEAHYLSIARRQAGEGQMEQARFSAALVLKVNPANAEACSIVAQATEKANSPDALLWHRRAVQLAPTIENRLNLADYLVQREAPPCAECGALLAGIPEQDRAGLPFHLVSARRALRVGDVFEAEQHFRQAVALEPGRLLHQLNLANALLASGSAAKASEARALLDALGSGSVYGAHALRSLIQDALNRVDLEASLRYSQRLLARKDATLADRLTQVDIQQHLQDEEWRVRLAEVQKEAQADAVSVHRVAVWMIEHRQAEAVSAWIRHLSPALQRAQPVPQAVAMSYAQRGDWAGLERWIALEQWGQQECLRLLYLWRAQRAQNSTSAAEQTGAKVMQLASSKPELLALVGEVSRCWGWTSEAEAALWAIAKRFPEHAWALDQLEKLYQERADGKGESEVKRFRAAREEGPGSGEAAPASQPKTPSSKKPL